MIALFRWLRMNSQKYLLESVQAELAREYLGRPPTVDSSRLANLFWVRLFAPIYRRLPWKLRRAIILSMPGSHRQGWPPPTLSR